MINQLYHIISQNGYSPESSDDDHSQNSGQEKYDDDAVDDGKPVNLHIAHSQIGIPAGCPADVRCFPVYRITEGDLKRAV